MKVNLYRAIQRNFTFGWFLSVVLQHYGVVYNKMRGKLMFGIVLILFITWKIYEYIYYKGERFKKLKIDLNNYIVSCNELNEHIEGLKETYPEVRKSNYGNAQLKDASIYNFKG